MYGKGLNKELFFSVPCHLWNIEWSGSVFLALKVENSFSCIEWTQKFPRLEQSLVLL